MKIIKVCIADDHKLFRRLTKIYLKTIPRIDGTITEAENGKDLLKQLHGALPDVVLLDIHMPLMGGEEAASVILKRYPEIKIVMLTNDDAPEKIIELMNMGVHGYLQKDCEPHEIANAIEAVVDKDFYKNELIGRALNRIGIIRKTGEERLIDELTNREKEILHHICQELTTKEIGMRLSISAKTVENHRMNMLQKLNVKNSVGMVKYAYKRGFMPFN